MIPRRIAESTLLRSWCAARIASKRLDAVLCASVASIEPWRLLVCEKTQGLRLARSGTSYQASVRGRWLAAAPARTNHWQVYMVRPSLRTVAAQLQVWAWGSHTGYSLSGTPAQGSDLQRDHTPPLTLEAQQDSPELQSLGPSHSTFSFPSDDMPHLPSDEKHPSEVVHFGAKSPQVTNPGSPMVPSSRQLPLMHPWSQGSVLVTPPPPASHHFLVI